jgi:hypothetical protein
VASHLPQELKISGYNPARVFIGLFIAMLLHVIFALFSEVNVPPKFKLKMIRPNVEKSHFSKVSAFLFFLP